MVSVVQDHAIIRIDLEGQIITWNQAAQRLFGYSSLEILGEAFFRLYHDCEQDTPRRHLRTDWHRNILILDISLPPPNGLEVAARLRNSLPQTKILLITMHDSEQMLRAAAAAGVAGYLLKSDAEELLVLALQTLQKGKMFVSPAFDLGLAKQLFI